MHDPTSSTGSPSARYAGIDWASDEHAVCVLGSDGQVRARFTVTHSRPALAGLVTRLRELGVVRTAIERADGPVVEALLAAQLPVAVIAPRMVKNLRSRHRGAGKDDRFDAYVLADSLRTDGHRLTDLTPDTPRTRGLRALIRARQDLVQVRVGLVNQLRHTLELAFPGAVGLFCDLHSPIARTFLRRFPTAAAAATLDEDAMAAWLHAEGYCGRTPAATFLHRLQTAPTGLLGVDAEAEADARRHVTLALLTAIDAVRARARDMRHPHAVRVLARAWTIVIWRCWQDRIPYNPNTHGGYQRHLQQTAAPAA